MLEDFNASCELLKIIKHFFPDLIPSLKQVNDPRNKSYITYESHVILFMRILSVVFHIGSMRGITAEFNKSTSIKNITGILNAEKLKELPHWKTINDYLERFENSELENIIQKLVSRLIRMRSFECSRIRNKYQSRNEQQPVTLNEQGVVLISGASPRVFSMVQSGNLSPIAFMLDTLNNERYAKIQV